MPAHIRLIAVPGTAAAEVHFKAAWAAPSPKAAPLCAPARLDTGDGHLIDLGLLCAPTAVTWCEQREIDLAAHRYSSAGSYTAQLHWGDAISKTTVAPGRPGLLAAALPAAALPTVALLAISPVADQPMQRLIKLRVEGLAAGQVLRLDAGAGHAHYFSNAEGEDLGIDVAAEIGATYAKPGPYTLMLDLIDEDGFWLATLAQNPIEIAHADEIIAAASPAGLLPEPAAAALSAEVQPWLPYRYVKPRYSVSTYAAPGGGAVRRNVNPGIYLSVRAEATVSDQTWLRTAQGDWIAASAVTFFRTSELRGIELGDGLPLPPPPPPPPPPRRQPRHRRQTLAAGSLPRRR